MFKQTADKKILKRTIQSKKFEYEKDGVVLSFSLNYDVENIKELRIFKEILVEACRDVTEELDFYTK